jgi:hypothetical protein
MTTGGCKAQNKLKCPHHGEALQRELFAPGGVADVLQNKIHLTTTVDKAVEVLETNGRFSPSALNLSRTILNLTPGVDLGEGVKLLTAGDIIFAFQRQKELSLTAELSPSVELQKFQEEMMAAAMQRKLFEIHKNHTRASLPANIEVQTD